jgi:hypothetical protein
MKTHTILLLLGLVVVLATGCGVQITISTPAPAGAEPQAEAAASSPPTAAAAEVASVAQPEPTAIPTATDIPSPTDTTNPTDRPSPTDTPGPPDTPEPTATVCNLAVELAGVNEVFRYWYVNSNPSFDLVLRNSGSCPWPEQTTLRLASENTLGWPASWDVGSVPVGGTQTVAILLKAPSTPQVLHIVWRLEGPAGEFIGPEISYDLRVELPPTPTPVPPTPTTVVTRREPPRTRNTTPEGSCGDDYDCDLVMLSDGFVRAKIRNTSQDKDAPDGKGISHVDFTVSDGNNQVHKRTERNAGYCIFGGGEPHCNPWPVEGGTYRWPDGARLDPGREYSVSIVAIADDGDTAANWYFQASFELSE